MKVKGQESRVECQKRWVALRLHVGESLRDSHSRLGETRPRGGMTLIELLVVIVILTTLVGAAIPLLSPSNDDRRLREATRGLNTYITGAQARAISLHRPFGIALKRLSQDTKRAEDNGVCLEVFYVEQPVPYSGFDPNSRVCVAIHPDQNNWKGYALVRFVARGTSEGQGQDSLPTGWDPDLFPTGMLRPGDVVQTGGTRLVLLAPKKNDQSNIDYDSATGYFEPRNGTAQILARPLNDSGRQIIPKYDNGGNEVGGGGEAPYWTEALPYKVLRQAAPAADDPYQLPEGTAIDLRASGVGSGEFFLWPGLRDNSEGILIMFTPEGRVGRVTFSTLPLDSYEDSDMFDQPVTENVFLLLGKRENVPVPDKDIDPTLDGNTDFANLTDEQRAKMRDPINWLNGHSRWIVIGSETGRIATVENAFVDPAVVMGTPPVPFENAKQQTEELRAAQIIAAREFTMDTNQLGGR